jgi:pimeloyl-ACP methyl ester carboxylesterase
MPALGKIATGRQAQLPDSRRLGFAEFGDLAGKPIFLFHPHPGSRLFRHPDDEIANTLGVRLITVDRPGFGLSDVQRGRRLLDWPDDVAHLADALDIDRFAVVGVGAGGAYAAACAYKIPRRVTIAGLVSSIAPADRRGTRDHMIPMLRNFYTMASITPTLLRLTLYFGAREAQHTPETYLSRLGVPTLCASDRTRLIDDADVRELMIEDIREAFCNNSTPFADDMVLVSRPWGFRLRDIRVPVDVWHGEHDVFYPVQMGHVLADEIFGSRVHTFLDEGYAVIFNHWSIILSTLSAV